MKRCLQRNRIEDDDAMAFCRVDGATLITFTAGWANAEAESLIKELLDKYAKQVAEAAIWPLRIGSWSEAPGFAWLEKSYRQRSQFMVLLHPETLLDPMKSDPRWSELLKRVGV